MKICSNKISTIFFLSGRNLSANNFSIELELQFNLGPLHLLQGIIQQAVEERLKQISYVRLKSSDFGALSAVVFNRRSNEDLCGKSKFSIFLLIVKTKTKHSSQQIL